MVAETGKDSLGVCVVGNRRAGLRAGTATPPPPARPLTTGKKLDLTPEQMLAGRREQVRKNMAAMRAWRQTDADAGGRATEGSDAVDEEASVAAAVAAAVAICGAPATVARTAPDAGAVAADEEAIRMGAERCTHCPRRYKGRAARMAHGRMAHGLTFKIGYDNKIKSVLESARWRPMTSWTGHPEVGTYGAQWSFQELGGALRADFVLAVGGVGLLWWWTNQLTVGIHVSLRSPGR